MEGVFNHFKMPVGERKEANGCSISTFEFSREKEPLVAMRAIMDGMPIYDGKYVRLHVHGQLMMSDTDMEKCSNATFCRRANGRVLIAGLGIGLVLKNILPKLESGEISEIVVIEKYIGVIALVHPYFTHKKIKVICADIMTWRPDKCEKFDTIYFDIWPTICTDNLKEISYLHNCFKSRLNRENSNAYMNSWMKEALQREKRKSRHRW